MEKLQEGRNYKLGFEDTVTDERGRNRKITRVKKMRLIRKYRYFALFEDAKGIKESFDYIALRKMLKGEEG